MQPFERINITGRFNAINDCAAAILRRADQLGTAAQMVPFDSISFTGHFNERTHFDSASILYRLSSAFNQMADSVCTPSCEHR